MKDNKLDENLIYAIGNANDISVLVRKNNKFYWKSLAATNIVWYALYETIEDACNSILELHEYKDRMYSPIQEFDNMEDFFKWSLKLIKKTKAK